MDIFKKSCKVRQQKLRFLKLNYESKDENDSENAEQNEVGEFNDILDTEDDEHKIR